MKRRAPKKPGAMAEAPEVNPVNAGQPEKKSASTRTRRSSASRPRKPAKPRVTAAAADAAPAPAAAEAVNPAPAVKADGEAAGFPVFSFRAYQLPVFWDSISGLLVLHWSRQIGKSYTLATWAVYRVGKQLETHETWLITVLSNSRDNGAEFCLKAAQACTRAKYVFESRDDSRGPDYQNLRMEIRITRRVNGRRRTGRIKVLAANPRTARGFSGDLILDEFAFHEDSNAIWEAAEPILSANREFLCRIASTGNGRHNMFYRLAAGPGPNDGTPFLSQAGYRVCRLTRTEAHRLGVEIYDPNTRQPITPEQARAKALDKRAYDQNYECQFNHENMCLLTDELIQQAERPGIPMDEQGWSERSLAVLAACRGSLHGGQDVGRHRDLSVIAIVEKDGATRRVVALLRMSGLRLPEQQRQLDPLFQLPNFRGLSIDMTGLGLGLVEYAQEKWRARVQGINFATTEAINQWVRAEGRKVEKTKVTENLATALLAAFEEKRMEICVELDGDARDDLRKPEKITSPGGRVSIAAVRDEAGHADHFWALALALRDAESPGAPVAFAKIPARPAMVGNLGMGQMTREVVL